MGQFCAYKNPNPATRAQYPFLLDIQSDLLSELRTTVVIPMTPSKLAAPMSLTRLNPSIVIDGKKFTVMTQEIAGVDRNKLVSLRNSRCTRFCTHWHITPQKPVSGFHNWRGRTF
jgi:toxin CcdB